MKQPMRLAVSVFIIAKNEEDRIATAIGSVRDWADEVVVVVDNSSEDKTDEVAIDAGADKVLYREWEGYGQQKRYAEDQCRNRWLINIDADEEISEELKNEIVNLFADGDPSYSAFRFRIMNMFAFEKKPAWLQKRKNPIRLYNRERARFQNHSLHDFIIFHEPFKPEKTITLRGPVYHRSTRNLQHMIQKYYFYCEMGAQKMFQEGRYPTTLRLISEPIAAFIRMYLMRGYFIYGTYGFSFSVIWSTGRFYRLARARELYKLDSLEKMTNKQK